MRIRNAYIAVIMAACCSALALASAAQRELITPPKGWIKETMLHPSPLGQVLEQWLSFSRDGEDYIEIGKRQSYGFNSASFAEYYRSYLNREKANIEVFRRITLCKSESGWYVKSQSRTFQIPNSTVMYHGHPVHVRGGTFGGRVSEDVFYVDGSHVYFVSYHMPPKLPPVAAAEHAIQSLCIPAPVRVKPLVLPVLFSPPPGFLMINPKETGVPEWPNTVAMFFDPSRRDDVIMLVRDRAAGEVPTQSEQAQEKAAQAYVQRENRNAKEDVLSYETYGMQPLCGDYNGVLFKYTAAYGKFHLAYETMILYGPTLYSAVYIHPVSEPAYKPASDSLKSICPLATPSPAPSASPPETPVPTPSVSP